MWAIWFANTWSMPCLGLDLVVVVGPGWKLETRDARERSRRAWENWDEAEIRAELAPWPR